MISKEYSRAGLRGAVLGLALTTITLAGCADEPVGLSDLKPWSCSDEGRRPGPDDVACSDAKRFVRGSCQAQRCDAEDSGCCPGTICTAAGACVVPPSRYTECTDDGNCNDGQRCLDQPLITTDARVCGFVPIDAGGSCPAGLVAFNGRCVETAPCSGACAQGTVCNIGTNRCEPPPTTEGGCDQVCGPSQLLVYADPDAMLFNGCCEMVCECATLPPLAIGVWGRYSDLAVGTSAMYASAYDSTYGDLVVARLGRLSGEVTNVEYVDGVPSGGAIVADPNGPRGGRDGPGPDVGHYTAIDLQPGTGEPRVIYYDIEAEDLKYAAYDMMNDSWLISVVDNDADSTAMDMMDDGSVGKFTSLVIDSTGIAHVTYYAHRVQPAGVLVTTPMYARALSSMPAGPDDWERVAVEPFDACPSPCAMGQVCALNPNNQMPECRDESTMCMATCDCDNTCIDNGGMGECWTQMPDALLQPCDGNCPSGFACVSDLSGGSICLQQNMGGCGGCGGDDVCVTNAMMMPECRLATPFTTINGLPEGVGLFTSLVLQGTPAVPTVIYYDRIRQHLRGAQANFSFDAPIGDFTTTSIACDPVEDFGQHATAAVAPDDSLAIAYQGRAGKTLWVFTGADIFDMAATTEVVDDGVRATRENHVGASASIAFDTSGAMYIAYADQTENDLLLAYQSMGMWEHTILLDNGAFGSFAAMAIDGTTAYVSNYQRERDEFDRDVSKLVVHVADLTQLP